MPLNKHKPNIVFVFGDQHRAQATGYSGNDIIKTPVLDSLKKESVSFSNAVSGNPVCSPYRASLLTGQYPLTHGVFVNDVCLNPEAVSIAKVLKKEGYQTAYIGKWHLDGHGRKNFIPRERRQGFDYWKVLECTHDYNNSLYYGDTPEQKIWEGYDAEAQTRCAQEYICNRDPAQPFVLFLSWGPPHAPYRTAPEEFQEMYDPSQIKLRPNVPEEDITRHPFAAPVDRDYLRKDIAGYYAHATALDSYLGELLSTLEEENLSENTIFVYTSDHGDMLGSHGRYSKQMPYDESIRVPFLLRYPKLLGTEAKEVDIPINAPDIMPTLLDLCDIPIPESVEGISFAPFLKGEEELEREGVLIECIHPFGQWPRTKEGREYRGIRTKRYTYVRTMEGPWLLFDNEKDPYQLENLCNNKYYQELQKRLDQLLNKRLNKRNDQFLAGERYIEKWGYPVDENGTVPNENTYQDE